MYGSYILLMATTEKEVEKDAIKSTLLQSKARMSGSE